MKFTDLFSANKIGIAIGVLGICLSIYFYFDSKEYAEPVIIKDPSIATIVSYDEISESPIRVMRADGSPINKSVSAAKFYFWNSGNKPIRSSEILEPIFLNLKNNDAEILDYKIISESRKVIKPHIFRNPKKRKQSIGIDFNILEQNDGFSFQVIYAGNANDLFTIEGTIIGVDEINTNNTKLNRSIFGQIINSMSTIILIIIIPSSILLLDYITRKILSRFKDKDDIDRIINKFGSLIANIFLVSIFVLIFLYGYSQIKNKAAVNIMSIVPESIKAIDELNLHK